MGLIVWIGRALTLAIHARQIAEHGGDDGLLDPGLLDAALARPRQRLAYDDPAPDLADLAASLAFGLARNHPFVDGNTRVAAVACETFLLLNGAVLDADDLELYPRYLGLADGSLTEAEFAGWLRAHVRVRSGTGVHEPRATYRR